MTKSSGSRVRRRGKATTKIRLGPVSVMSIDESKVIDPFDTFYIADKYCSYLGKLAITWGCVENHLDNMITALQTATGELPVKGRPSFKQRKERCKALGKEAFGPRPEVLSELEGILAAASDLHWQRNTLLHGKISNRFEVVGKSIEHMRLTDRLSARGRHNGKMHILTFDTAGVEDLFYRIANVAGEFRRFTAPDVEIPFLMAEDRVFLRDWIVAHHPNPTTPPTPKFQPRAPRR